MNENNTTTNAPAEARTVTVTIPSVGSLFGLGTVIEWLLIGAAWMCLGIMYLCVPGSLVAAVLAVLSLAVNVGNAGAMVVCLGAAIACVGSCLPILRTACWLRVALLNGSRALLGKEKSDATVREFGDRRMLMVSLVLLAVGAAVWGAGALMGGMDVVVLPGFIAGMLA